MLRTRGGVLEVSTIRTTEVFDATVKHSVFGIEIGEIAPRIRVPAIYRFYVELEPEWRVVFYFSLTGTILGGAGTLPAGFTSHTPSGLTLLAVIGVSTLLAQLAMTRAYGRGRTLAAANLQFSAIVFASALGVLLFDDRIPLIGWAGIAVIVASGIASTALTARRRALRGAASASSERS